MPNTSNNRNPLPDHAPQPEQPESTLLPMLIVGLVLIVVCMAIVMNFF